MDQRRIVIDTDPGIDDAVAILLAFGSSELGIDGIVAVSGNVPLAAEHFHGEEGLGNLALPAPSMALRPQHGVDFTVELLRAAPAGSVTWCALGPLTNVAMALIKAPDIVPGVRELVLMGGASRALGNVTPAAEFNIHADPHAAEIVFDSGMPITMIPLDATHQVRSTKERVDRIAAIGSPVAAAVAELLRPVGDTPDPLPHPSLIAYLLAPDLFETTQVNFPLDSETPFTLR